MIDKYPSSRLSTNQAQTLATSSTPLTNAFGSQTYQIRVACTTAAYFRVGDGTQTATTADPLLPASTYDYVTVTPGQKIAVLGLAAGGIFTVTEMS